jgi:hypothetical protein
MRRGQKILFLFLLSTLGLPLFSQELLNLELWTELDPIVENPDRAPKAITNEEAYKLVLDEARYLISGMIYGFSFTYTPSDNARGVKEYFDVQPIAQIPFGDKNLQVEAKQLDERRMYVRVTYLMFDHQESRRQSWMSLAFPTQMGKGEGNMLLGPKERITAYSQSIKEAVRSYLRARIFNKPREIRGAVLLVDCPTMAVFAGSYVATSRFKVNIMEIVPYTVF